jgi:hypothetical protein
MRTHKAVLVAAILMLGLGAAFCFAGPVHQLEFTSLAFLAGAVVVNYKYPVSTTVAPTSLVMQAHNELNAQVTALDADTVITITHNWGLPSKDGQGFPDGPAGLFPAVIINLDVSTTSTIEPIFTVNLANTNAVVINKPTTVGTQGTYNVVILRPTSMIK